MDIGLVVGLVGCLVLAYFFAWLPKSRWNRQRDRHRAERVIDHQDALAALCATKPQPNRVQSLSQTCAPCYGSGRQLGRRCPVCYGTGKIPLVQARRRPHH